MGVIEMDGQPIPIEKGKNDKQWSKKNYTENGRLSSTNHT
jgi:hypothetical protein